ncbi:MAG: choice-of-anchor J domain-containing protein [Brumimicrobium sp.]
MKKIYLLLGSLSLLLFNSVSQTINEPANWPNTNWTINGTYDAGSLLSDPTVDTDLTFDDDGAGSGSVNALSAESPIIDLTAASSNGEEYLLINFDYVFNDGFNAAEFLNLEYWDDDAGSWVVVESLIDNSTSAVDYENCDDQDFFESSLIDISSFTTNQLSNFQYRFNYDDAGSWAYGFCISSPLLLSLSCPDPTNLTDDFVGGDEVDISWTENGSATEWNIEWGATGFAPGTGNEDGEIVGTTNNPETITGLTPVTDYDIYVQADCGGGDESAWIGPLSVTTTSLCPDPSNLTEDFTDATSSDVSWTENGSATEWSIEWGATGFAPGTGNEDGAINNTTNNPESITGLTPSTDYDVYVQADCGANGQSTWIGPLEITTADPCSDPIDLNVDILSFTEVDFSWTEIGTSTEWNIEYGLVGFAPGTGAEEGLINNTTNLSEVISGLTAGEEYDFYVQADCGGSPSNWSGPETVLLDYCLPTYSSTFDYMTLFETLNAVENVNYTASSHPAGGYEDLTSTDTLREVEGNTIDFETNYQGGGNAIRIWADWNNNLDFESSEELYFQYQAGNPNNAHYGDITIPAGTPAGSYRMRVRSEYGSAADPGPCTAETYGSTIDIIVEVLPVPTCPRPTDVIASNVTPTDADIDWTENGSATEWIIEYDTTGFVQGNGNTMVTTNNPETISGLTANTSYDVYVRAICSAGDTSLYGGPFMFTTECEVFDPLDFCESFDSGSQTQNCWTVLDENGDGDEWDMDYTFNPNSGDEVAMINTDFNSGANDDWLITPQISLNANEVMNFFYRVQSSNEPNDFEVLLSTTGKAPADFQDTLMYLDSYSNENYLDTTLDLTSFTGDVYIAFHVPSGGLDGWRLYIDDVCFDVCIPESGQDGGTDVCRADGTADLNSLIVKGQENGSWVYPGNQQLVVDDSLFNISNLPSGEYEVLYIVEGGCTNDTTVATLEVYPPSSAGQNGDLNVCLNEPIDLFNGLSGNLDLGGTWYNSSDDPLADAVPHAPSIAGTYNYDYIVSNGVCSADTSLVTVTVTDTCDYLSLGEEKLTELSVYPNPATDMINISNPTDSESLRIEMLDMNGRVVVSDADALSNTSEATIAIDHLQKGIYTLRIYNDESQRTFKVVKQ